LLLIDRRTGSGETQLAFEAAGMKTAMETLEFGDYMFEGNGPESTVAIGIERKKIGDLVDCIKEGRFEGRQLKGMQDFYQYRYLLVEGLWKASPDGYLKIWRRGEFKETRMVYAAVIGLIEKLQTRFGWHYIRTGDVTETVQAVCAIYRKWQKPWEVEVDDVYYTPALVGFDLEDPFLATKTAALIQGIGKKKARNVGRHFRSVAKMVAADADEWMLIDGIWRNVAEHAVMALHTEGAKK
jgi:ERCC4-type nuclease